ncbi:MAG: tRNA pseudouridine(38-40) synthase TruA [Candidatus Marinimicrobia bacterium]|nr:tRNA pseudouridine(38-40) synthase TruA [Candidatus Neomarinimicrobiota bacterium]
MRRFRFKVEYDGSAYAGWQVQDNAPTVQGEIEKALQDFNGGQLIRIQGSGRTDTGVHAFGQVAQFDFDTPLPPVAFEKALNAKTPADIYVYDFEEVDPSFHCRFDAIRRTYIYKITTRFSPMLRNYYWYVRWNFDFDLLQQCAQLIEGEHNFESFCRTADQASSKVCFIYNSAWKKDGNLLTYRIAGTRFLHSMVRMLVGTMMEVARGKRPIEKFHELLETTLIDETRYTAPAHGLYLAKVEYKNDRKQ